MDREELAWAAGLFDGEGCTSLNTKRNGRWYGIRLAVAQNSIEVLERFQGAVGVGRVYGPYKGEFSYCISGFENVQYVLALLWEWLSEPKRFQAENVLRYYHSFERNPKRRRKLNADKAEEIRQLFKDGVSYQQIATRFNVDEATVSRVVTGKSWAQV